MRKDITFCGLRTHRQPKEEGVYTGINAASGRKLQCVTGISFNPTPHLFQQTNQRSRHSIRFTNEDIYKARYHYTVASVESKPSNVGYSHEIDLKICLEYTLVKLHQTPSLC